MEIFERFMPEIGRFQKFIKEAFLLFSYQPDVFEQTFTASGSITFPNSLSALTVVCVGGGGSGGFPSGSNGTVGCVYIRYEY